MEIEIRLATAGDVVAIESCINAAYAPYVERIGKRPAPMLADHVVLVGDSLVRVAVDGDRVVGAIVMWPEPDHWYVDTVAVLPERHGVGIGVALLADADRAALAAGRSEIRLYTNVAMTENLTFYPRRGFVETHRAEQDGYQRVFFSRQVV